MGLFIRLETLSYGSCWQALNTEPSRTSYCVFVSLCVRVCCTWLVLWILQCSFLIHCKLELSSAVDVRIAYLTASLLVGSCEYAHTVCMSWFLGFTCEYRASTHTQTHTDTHTKHTWPSITVSLPLRQQMLQPCHNSLAVWNQTVSFGPLGCNLLTLQSAPLSLTDRGLPWMLPSCALKEQYGQTFVLKHSENEQILSTEC